MPLVSGKGSGYYIRENMFEEIRDLKRVLTNGLKPPFNETEKEITFHGLPLKEHSQRMIRKKFGNPIYILDNSKSIDGHKVYFYKDSVNVYKFLIQYHFINDEFFFACNKVSSIRILSEDDKAKVIGRIKTKYFGEDANEIEGLMVKVKDPNNNILFTRDDVYYYLNYLVFNKTTKQLLEKYSNYEPAVSKPPGLNDSLDEYI